MKLLNTFMAIVGIVILIAVLGLIFSLPVMLLWNYCLVGAIAGINQITWLQAWGIMVLFGILFKTSVTSK